MGITSAQWQKVKEIYEVALDACTPQQRTAYVNKQTKDEVVRAEVLRLLAETDILGSFLSTPPFVDRHNITAEVQERLVEGQILAGRFRIIGFIAAGGMGEVYKAEDTRLGRIVVLKFLPKELSDERGSLERFRQEAKSASALNQPNICTVYDLGEDAGRAFIAMEYLEGETLSSRLKNGPLPLREALRIAIDVTSALEAAHRKGIVHRDIKPGNIMLTNNGAKLLDFGLAKYNATVEDLDDLFTGETTIVGTLSYMSPEQLEGKPVDIRTDIFSFGTVLYEMLSGKPAFRRSKRDIDLSEEAPGPLPLGEFVKNVPSDMERIVQRCLSADPERRYSAISEVRHQLQECYQSKVERGFHLKRLMQEGKQPRVWIPAFLMLTILVAGSVWWIHRSLKMQWAREQALPQIAKLVEQGKVNEAYALAVQADRYIPHDPMLAKFWPLISWSETIKTTPPSASVFRRSYNSPDGAWEFVGRTPIKGRKFPTVASSWKFELNGYRTVERATFPDGAIAVTLEEEGKAPENMVRVQLTDSPGKTRPVGLGGLFGFDFFPPVPLSDFWIDKYEVTNSEFKRFVEQGGYWKRDYWKEDFVKDGRVLSWTEAMKLFVDTTGDRGPSTWAHGDYPKGQENYPVSGISWYEAVAYAQFAGKALPTMYHWRVAASPSDSASILPLSNFRGSGTAPAGKYSGMSWSGAFDMAGNVKEWVWNDDKFGHRYILGGAWNEPNYMFFDVDARSPFARSENFGFRCAKYVLSGDQAKAKDPIHIQLRDFNAEKPVSESVFQAYKRLYSYDKTPLHAAAESVQETTDWTKQKITFDAAYGNERVIAYLYLPKNASPPFQAVVYFTGAGAFYKRSSTDLGPDWLEDFEFIVKSGRAVMFVVFKGMFERWDDFKRFPRDTSAYRDHVIDWSKDLGRSIDYLETRSDIDHNKLAYKGTSFGAAMGSLLPAVETRLKALVLVSAGLSPYPQLPEADQFNFAPRVRTPVLMLNGRYDFVTPAVSSQEPMFRLLGTPAEDKRRVVYDSGHDLPNAEVKKESVSWLDRYLGDVSTVSTSR